MVISSRFAEIRIGKYKIEEFWMSVFQTDLALLATTGYIENDTALAVW